jgi:hypothetical protein
MLSMKSIKKRFKNKLQAIEQSALELEMLSADVGLMEVMTSLARQVLQLCEYLNARVVELNKTEFVEAIRQDERLLALDELADEDVMSVLEERFFLSLGECQASQLGEFIGQFLEKLEKPNAKMLKEIRALGGLLSESD